jgi:hypothetical protein
LSQFANQQPFQPKLIALRIEEKKNRSKFKESKACGNDFLMGIGQTKPIFQSWAGVEFPHLGNFRNHFLG